MDIHGYHSGSMAPVIEAFAAGFDAGREVGAAMCVIHKGDTVVDVWAGHTDRKRQQPWQEDTLVCCFSISKAITATAALLAVDRGLMSLNERVATYWPEFGAAGKEAVSVRELFCHQAGLPGFREAAAQDIYYRWDDTCAQLAATEPWWPPGTAHGYHARTFGFLLGEVTARATGVPFGQWMRDELLGPLGLDVAFGLSEEQQARCADMLPAKVKLGADRELPVAMQRMLGDFNDTTTPTGAAFQNPAMPAGYMNSAEFRSAVIPAVNGHGTARDITKLFADLGVVLSPTMLALASSPHAEGADRVLKSRTRFGLGYMLWEEESPIGRPGCFGHAGAGGSLAFYDPSEGLAFTFVMNQMQEGVVTGGSTATACVDALFGVL